LWLAANGIVLVLLAVVLGEWARSRVQVRNRVVAAAASMTLAVALLLLFFKREQVPVGWITVLMEGPSIRNLQQLYGQGAHFGTGFQALGDWLTGHDATTLPAIVHVNVCLALVNAIIFFFLALHVLESWWASLAFALVYAANLNTLHAAFSETPAGGEASPMKLTFWTMALIPEAGFAGFGWTQTPTRLPVGPIPGMPATVRSRTATFAPAVRNAKRPDVGNVVELAPVTVVSSRFSSLTSNRESSP